MTQVQQNTAVLAAAAAMEPAAQQRDDLTDANGRRRLFIQSPQWSPPLSSGMTLVDRQNLVLWSDMPQWSPPLSSGMTAGNEALRLGYVWPRWSPPLSSGMTAEGITGRRGRVQAAMEPAAQQRDDRTPAEAGDIVKGPGPQWSPPLSSGMTYAKLWHTMLTW